MKISQNFDIREFVPKRVWDKFGLNSTWFVNEKAVKVAEFIKSFFTTYYKKKLGNDKVQTVLVVINNWHTGGTKQFCGLRLKECVEYKEFSQHSFMNAIDPELYIKFTDGTIKEVDYVEIHKVIHEHESEFLANGITSIEDVSIAVG